MDDQSNPYASPLAPTAPFNTSSARPLTPKHRWLSRALLVGLLLNVPAIAVTFALAGYVAWVEDQQQGQDPPVALTMFVGFSVLGAAAYWPLSSLALFVYSITVDRGTSWWVLKAIVSAVMLLMFLLPCVLAIALA